MNLFLIKEILTNFLNSMNLFQENAHYFPISRHRICFTIFFSFYSYCNLSRKLNCLMSLITLLSLLKLKGNNIKYILLCVQYSWVLAKPLKILWIFKALWLHILLDIRCSPRYCYKSYHSSNLLSSNIYKLRYV